MSVVGEHKASGDPLTDVRSDIYRLSGRRRREALSDSLAVRPAEVTETQLWRPNVGIAELGNDHLSHKEKSMSHSRSQGTALITGASRGIGAVLSRLSKGLPPSASTARRRPPSGVSCEPGPVELKDRRIRSNVLSPGPTEPPAIGQQPADAMARIVSTSPMGRMGEPDEIAKAALFLASDDSSDVTGIELCVDGGRAHL